MLKVRPAGRDLEQLKQRLKTFPLEDAAARWQSAAKLGSASVEFNDEVYRAIIHLLFGSIAARHRVRPHDRREIKNSLSREREATRLIAEACRLYGRGSAPRELERVLLQWIEREVEVEFAAAQIGKMPRGRGPYRAFTKFVRLVGGAYETASKKLAIVKINNARSADERYSGPFGELLEAVYADATAIWKKAGFKTSLDGPNDKNARLEFARKEMLKTRAKRRSG